jgi:predicted ATP-dependent endonuclease of OLD family
LKSIYPDIEERFRSRPDTDSGFTRRAAHFLELVNFGMKDVTSLLTQTSQNLRDFSRSQVSALTVSYLRDVILNKIGEGGEFYSANVDSNLLISAVSLLDNASLLNEERAALANRLGNLSSGSSSEEKHFLHFVSMLADFARKVRGNEAKAQNFVTLVNKYLYGKSVSLSDSSYDFTVSDSDGGKIDLQDLSSGEKQVISLFSHIMLENADPFAIIIDEPELSLSVRWQEEFLPDVYSQESCKFLLAVTHSPSIIDNDMREYAIDVRKLFKRVA